MLTFRLMSLWLIFIFSFAAAAAQTAADKATDKTKEADQQQIALLEQIAKNAEALRLPENRALTAAKVGEGFWRHDEKRARAYFQEAVDQVIAAQTQAEADKKQQAGTLYGLLNGIAPRQEILTMIAVRDAELALDSFYKSRPLKIAQILMNPDELKKPTSLQSVQNEIYFEQSLISKVAEQNPQRALKMIRESLSKGVTYEVFGLIEKLKNKDPELAAQFAGEVADKLLASDPEKLGDTYSLASSFVAQFGGKFEDGGKSEGGAKPEGEEKPLKVDEKKLRELTAMMAKVILKSEDEYGYDIGNMMPQFVKFAPESVAALKQKQARMDNQPERREYAKYEKFLESNPSPEKLLSEADKYSESFRSQIYYAAAEKSAQSGNIGQAQKIISSKMSAEETENYLTQINYNLIGKAISDGRYDEAALLINQIPGETSRFSLLLQMATSIYQKNPAENKKQSLAVIEQARGLIPQPAETIEEMSQLMQLAMFLTDIELEQSFQMIEAMTQPINEYVEAATIVAKYRNDGTLRQGEILINAYGGISGFYNLAPVLVKLRGKDFKNTLAYVNGFQRLEVRISLLLQLIENTPPDAKPDVPAPPAPTKTMQSPIS